MKLEHFLMFGSVTVASWFLFTYFWPRMMLYVYKRVVLVTGLGGGPIPVNTLYAVPELGSPTASSWLLRTGANRDTLYVAGWLDLGKGPQVLHVPEMAGRYYSVQFTDPSNNINFAYVGKRTTGTQAGDFLITGQGWKGQIPSNMTQISSPKNSVLVLGRVFVESDSDVPAAYGLAKQIQLSPLDN